MKTTAKRTSLMAAAVAAASMFFFPSSASAAPQDVVAAVQNAQIPVSRLNVVQTEGITILRGQVTRREYGERIAEVVRHRCRQSDCQRKREDDREQEVQRESQSRPRVSFSVRSAGCQ